MLSLNPFHVTGLFQYPLTTSRGCLMFLGNRERGQWHEMGSMVLRIGESQFKVRGLFMTLSNIYGGAFLRK